MVGRQLPTTTIAVYGVGVGAVDPAGTGEGASVEPCVFGGFLFADFFEAGVGDGLLIAAVVVLVPVVPIVRKTRGTPCQSGQRLGRLHGSS